MHGHHYNHDTIERMHQRWTCYSWRRIFRVSARHRILHSTDEPTVILFDHDRSAESP
jgi:hypothetical protein